MKNKDKIKNMKKEISGRKIVNEELGFWYSEGGEIIYVGEDSSDKVKLRARKTLEVK